MTQIEIEAFLTVIECGSFSAAAKKLYIGQPTLSARIQTLETKMGTTFFNRKRGQKLTELTAAGRSFEVYARKWLRLMDETQAALKKAQREKLHIAIGQSVNAYIMPEVYIHLPESVRQIALRFDGYHYIESFHMVESGEADVGFVANQYFSRKLNVYPIYREPLVMLHRADSIYPPMVHPQELDTGHEIAIGSESPYNTWHNYWFGDSEPLVQTNDAAFAERFITINQNWAIAPLTMANALKERGVADYSLLTNSPEDRIMSLICLGLPKDYPGLFQILEVMSHVVDRLGGEWLFD